LKIKKKGVEINAFKMEMMQLEAGQRMTHTLHSRF